MTLLTGIANRESVLRAIIENMAGGVVMFDCDLRLTAWNTQLEQLFELPAGLAREMSVRLRNTSQVLKAELG